MFLVDTAAGRIVSDDEIKASLAAEHPYGEWLAKSLVHLEDLPPRMMLTPQHASVVRHQRLFGVTNEELRLIIEPMARTGAEPDRLDGLRHAHSPCSRNARGCCTTTSPSSSRR